ncbi:unnamed protein product [Durusdinium trenchii]|uniref:Uncharacterized protein n=1 Tax=Durusdinium trenchii TaxID=1381693 RepID=A0ABP0QZ35_9DINO
MQCAKKVLDLGAPYLGCLIFTKVLALASSYAEMGFLVEILLSLAAFLTLLDIAVRVAASRNRRFSPSKHGADALLFVLFTLQCFLCGRKEARPSCRALRLVLPFSVLVSVGGNMMRMTRKPKPPGTGDAEEGEITTLGGSAE